MVFLKHIMKTNNILIAFFRFIGDIILKFFSANKAWKEFQEVILEYKKAFVPNLEVWQLVSIKRSFIVNRVW